MVHFPGFAPSRLWIQRVVSRFYRDGFPHSEIPGSMPACGSPGLIAACHVLPRLLLPRHPPCALSSLTIKFTRRSGSLPTSARILRPWICSSHPLSGPAHRRTDLRRNTPADLSALKKFTQPCRLPNRFSCQTSSRPENLPPGCHLGGEKSQISNLNQFEISNLKFANLLVELAGIEPATPCLQSRCSPS